MVYITLKRLVSFCARSYVTLKIGLHVVYVRVYTDVITNGWIVNQIFSTMGLHSCVRGAPQLGFKVMTREFWDCSAKNLAVVEANTV